MVLTVGMHLAIPTLIGRGLTETAARRSLASAARKGSELAQIGPNRVVPISYANGKFTIGV